MPEHKNPVNRILIALYRPVIAWVLKARMFTILLAVVALVATVWPARQLGSEFMPALDEGTLMYMPTTLPGLSVTKAAELMQMQDRIIRSFPEVETVFGKAGRALTATDPAPTEMFETIIQLQAARGMAARRDDGLLCAPRWTRRCSFPACRTPGRSRSVRASTCWRPEFGRRSG